MTLDEKIESARKKKEEGDHIFTSGDFLRAYRRYFKVSNYNITNIFACAVWRMNP